uniref:RING-type domain-containing protein n=1 Tax=Kwoniella bestiolae CBS 10118 TaxID=1296100 RepID=A0A1B9G0Y2_9TREE|nr:hypothetical protein I302_06145 [Kwoniella bestiolae CBS 10118]OCF24684.1 hypothetical protein I302_06145 [Kwoniella bestiolae CBS 10118]
MSTSSSTLTSGWYTNAYSGPFRSNRLRAPSLLPGSRRPIPNIIPVQQTLVVDQTHNTTPTNNTDDNKNVRRRETIFGPDVGEDDEPGWTENKNQEIGVEKVKEWVERSKNEEGLHATTTLQALVNLKRPTLLLHQIENITVAAVTSSPQRGSIGGASQGHFKRDSVNTQIINAPPLHGLSFKYDATTPLVRVQLEIYPTPRTPAHHVDGDGAVEGKESISDDHDNEPKIIYSGLHQGGFNQSFTLPHTSALDLSDAIIPIEEQQHQEQQEADAAAATAASTANEPQNVPVPEPVTTPPGEESGGSRWRRGLFRRNREQDLEAATGIEMTNRLDANGQPITANAEGQAEGGETEKKKPVEKGMRLLIRIDGVGPEGEPLPRNNAQLTHILISGTWVTDNNASTTNTTQLPEQGQLPGKRVWVVKVARREAVIGSHTFLLKEIYGLSSTSTSSSNTQYPPTQDDPYASTPNECIVCLTSPRDVVLLPCRHLVVCRDCAVGMVEYGAGGKVGRREDAEANTGAGAGADAAATGTNGGTGSANNATAQVAGGTTTQGRERRKKKVKGWYCPVCRQPYTSLLRLALPNSDSAVDAVPTEHELARVPSRAASVRTTRTARSVLAPSIAPTLPDGAERMLDALRPDDVRARDNEEDDEEDEVESRDQRGDGGEERPQFVLGGEGEDKKDETETEHKENINDTNKQDTRAFDLGQPISSTGLDASARRSQEGKGWKEV